MDSAVALLKRATELDSAGKYGEALVCYQEGIQLLMTVLKGTSDEGKRKIIREKLETYISRAEVVKGYAKDGKLAGPHHEQIQIAEDAIGFSYSSLLGRFLDGSITSVEVEDPYVRSNHQVYNFLRFCELMVTARSVKQISLLTGLSEDYRGREQQMKQLNEIEHSLKSHGIDLSISYSDTLHDREIRFSNGWIIKIGRGLDYFKPTKGRFAIGFCNFDLRPCHETTVDIYHRTDTVKSS